jgi:HTH-type transcriptional regulator/antitoxin HigA
MITAINSENDYKAALHEIEGLIDRSVKAGTPEGDRLNILTLLVQDYEQKRIESQAPDPIDALRFRMEQMALTPRDLVPLIGSRSKVSEVLSRKRPLTLSMVRALHKGLGIPAKSLLREQTLFESDEADIQWERFPLREMIRRGWLRSKPGHLTQNAYDLMQQFLAPLGRDWAPTVLYKHGRYIRSARQMDPYALAAWNARVCIRSLGSPPRTGFDRTILTLSFMHELAHLSTLSDGPRQACEYLENVGISVVIEPHLPETFLDGAALLVDENRPAIGLTIRHDRLDNFWFVLMHELIHVARHLSAEWIGFYDDLDIDDTSNPQEREADNLAGEALIPDHEWRNSPARNLRTSDAVEHLARRLRIHPAIVAGKIRHHYKSYRVLNRLVGQGEVRRLFSNFGDPHG